MGGEERLAKKHAKGQLDAQSVNLELWLVTCRAMASLLVLAVSTVAPS
jgi:hypothetical protein